MNIYERFESEIKEMPKNVHIKNLPIELGSVPHWSEHIESVPYDIVFNEIEELEERMWLCEHVHDFKGIRRILHGTLMLAVAIDSRLFIEFKERLEEEGFLHEELTDELGEIERELESWVHDITIEIEEAKVMSRNQK